MIESDFQLPRVGRFRLHSESEEAVALCLLLDPVLFEQGHLTQEAKEA